MMKIAIIGAGNVGMALARALQRLGHEICFGVSERSIVKYQQTTRDARLACQVMTNQHAVDGAELVILATPWRNSRDALAACGDFKGKVLIDCTNPLKPDLSGLELGGDNSGAEQIARWAPTARVIKSLNHTGAETMAAAASFPGGKPVMFVCGDDATGKEVVLELVDAIGFDAIDAGPLDAARLLEPLAMLWINLAYKMDLGRSFAFAVLQR